MLKPYLSVAGLSYKNAIVGHGMPLRADAGWNLSRNQPIPSQNSAGPVTPLYEYVTPAELWKECKGYGLTKMI